MGSQVLLDILAAMFIGGTLLLTLQRVNQEAVAKFFYYNEDFLLQRELVFIIEVIERDLKRIGYASDPLLLPRPSEAIRSADSSMIKFAGDVDADGTVDTITYTIGTLAELSNTRNPRDRVLYRKVSNNAPSALSRNVTLFRFDYFDVFSQPISTPITSARTGAISALQLSIEVESNDAFEQDYSQAYWRQVRLSAKNLNNR